ncbi:L-xylulose reductase-like [Convolutriloba macropyga]|uniref:L-xylulose reductase-like n=1 Tax=Convolutriloba macropyga TaxID=536237 RepID=UPI003F523AF5
MTDSVDEVVYPELSGKRVVVTGAGKGIGEGLVGALIKQSCFVIAISRTQSDLDKLREKYEDTQLQTVQLDISNWQEVESAFERLDPFHYLINNAGVSIVGPFLEVSENDYDSVFNVNVKAHLHVAQLSAKKMVSHNIKGVIVNMSSQASQKPLQDHTLYCCSKAAVDMLTRIMSLELGPKGIRTVSINPTVVLTQMGKMAWSDPVKSEPMLARIPLGKFAEVSDVIKPVLFCLSEGAAMVHGCHLPVDGGFLSL